MEDIEIPDVTDEPIVSTMEFPSENTYDQYDNVPCDMCGEKIEHGHTELHTGHIVHHECAN